MAGAYKTSEVYSPSDGKYAFLTKASNGQTVATDGGKATKAGPAPSPPPTISQAASTTAR